MRRRMPHRGMQAGMKAGHYSRSGMRDKGENTCSIGAETSVLCHRQAPITTDAPRFAALHSHQGPYAASVKSVESVRKKRGICEKKRKDDDTPQCPSVARRGWSDRHKRQRCGAAQGSRTAPRTLFLDEDYLLDARDAARGTGLGVPIEPEIVHFVAVGSLQVARERAVIQVQVVVGDGHHIV